LVFNQPIELPTNMQIVVVNDNFDQPTNTLAGRRFVPR